MKLKHRLISLLLCLTLVLAVFPAVAMPTADAAIGALIGGFAFNQLASRAMLGLSAAITAIGDATGDPETAALVNKWALGISDPSLEAIANLSKQMTKFHNEVMNELNFIEEKLDKNLSGIESSLGFAAVSAAHTNYLNAWSNDVTIPMAQHGYNQVVNSYKVYLEYAGSYKTGSTVIYGGQEVVATEAMVEACRDSFHAALITMSGASYNGNSGMSYDEYYDQILFETNTIDQKVHSTINNLLGRMLNASGAPNGGRYIDRAAQLAFAYFPFSEDQAAFVDAAVKKQAYEITMALMAYQEFIGMRLTHCDNKYKALEDSGASDADLATVQAKINNYCLPNASILQLIAGGSACTYPGGVVASVNTWASAPLYLSNANNSYLYLQDYIRATDSDTVTLINTNFAEQSDYNAILAQSKEGTVSCHISEIDKFFNTVAEQYLSSYVETSAEKTSQYMEFIRRGVVTANQNGQATVKYIYLLADDTADKSDMLLTDLRNLQTSTDLAVTPFVDYPFSVPTADYYNLRDGVYSDGLNTATMINGTQLQRLFDNNHLSMKGGNLHGYFSTLMGSYPEGRNLFLLSDKGTTAGQQIFYGAEKKIVTDFYGFNMLTTTAFSEETSVHSDHGNTSYAVLLTGDSDITYGKLTAEADDGLTITLSGDGYDAATGKTMAASAVTVTVKPAGCSQLSRITAQYHEDQTNPAKITYTDILADENTVDTLSYGDDGAVELTYYMPYTNVTLVAESNGGHTFSDAGFCPTCGAYEPALQGENTHLISNAGQLYWFSAAVRGDMTHISEDDLPELDVGQSMAALYGTITAPIDLSAADDPWVPIGTSDTPYRGSFNGGNQPITNLNGMLFGYASSVSLRNIAIESGSFGPDDDAYYAGSIVGSLSGDSSMTHCYSKATGSGGVIYGAGGLVGNFNSGIMHDCYYAGSLTGISNGYVGGLVGAGGYLTIENCSVSAAMGKTKSGGLAGDVYQPTITNSYYDSSWAYGINACCSNASLATDAAKSNDAYKGGEVAYLLNAGRENTVWYQTIGEQDYPEFTGLQVYHIEDGDYYSNDPNGVCSHPEEKLSQSITNSFRKHTIHTTCTCGEYSTSVTEDCVDENSDNYCDICGGYLICNHTNAQPYVTRNDDGTHTTGWNCGICGESASTTTECSDENGDSICDTCGGELPEEDVLLTIAGVNMTLGNELKLNFLIKASDIDTSRTYTATLRRDGWEDRTEEFAYYNDMYYSVAYTVAAKEMSDEIAIEVLDDTGAVISVPFARSVQDYAMTLLGATFEPELKSVVVDMLNYGTEAQKYFGYNEELYANAEITAQQQEEYATKDAPSENTQQPGKNFVGSNLSLEYRILLNLFFRDLSEYSIEDLSATVSYTDYKGNAVRENARIEVNTSTLHKVVVDHIVLADARCPVTIQIHDTEGNLLGEATESAESYIARNLNTDYGPVSQALLNFSDSAYLYLGGTN